MNEQDIRRAYVCCICGLQVFFVFAELCASGWFWERRVGIVYDYYCPDHTPKRK